MKQDNRSHRRRIRRLQSKTMLQTKRLQRRGLFIGGGLCVGLAAVVMAITADYAQRLFRDMLEIFPYGALYITPLGFAFCAWITRRFVPGAQGSGIPQVIAARQTANPSDRWSLVSLKVAFAKIAIMSMGLLFGASTGREGPTVQVGASIMCLLHKYAPKRNSDLILAGAAAGVAAAFNTPLAGIVFAIEELSQAFEVGTSGLLIATIIAAGITSIAIFGDYTYFGTSSAVMGLGSDWFLIVLIGILGGLCGGLFSRILVLFTQGLPGKLGQAIKSHPVIFALICGIIVAVCGLLSQSSVFGTGYHEARLVVEGSEHPYLIFAPMKFIATIFSSVSGIPGGIFAPSLSIGAGLGAIVNNLLPSTSLGACALLGMVAYLTGVVQAPITAFVIVLEMTNNHAMIVPLMAVALIAKGTSKLIIPQGVYHILAKHYLPQADRQEDLQKQM